MDPIPKAVLARLPRYMHYLTAKRAQGAKAISSATVAAELGLNAVLVRKDFAQVTDCGRPRTGFDIDVLMRDLARFLGLESAKEAVLVGAGHLGRALMAYEGFEGYGLNILAAFDISPGAGEVHGKPVLPMEELEGLVERMGVRIGIIAVPAAGAQAVCDRLVAAGIRAIWNFAPAHLAVPEGIIVQNEDIAASLALLSNKLATCGQNA